MYYDPADYNSKGIVPSLCETYGINYVGADAYAQLLCNDKTLHCKEDSWGSGYYLIPDACSQAAVMFYSHGKNKVSSVPIDLPASP